MTKQPKVQISVLIITRNRAHLLKECLSSLVKQDFRGSFEVVVVDNGSSDETKQVVASFTKKLLIIYAVEKKVGTPFARNLSLKVARGSIFAFIDDDCLAEKKWLSSIVSHFKQHKKSPGVIGYSKAISNSVPSLVEQLYYERWLLSKGISLKDKVEFYRNIAMDTKNSAFKKKVFNTIVFSEDASFGIVSDEDLEIGTRIDYCFNQIWFDPQILVTHANTLSFKKLFYRNFWSGFSTQCLALKNRNKPGSSIIHFPTIVSFFQRFVYYSKKVSISRRFLLMLVLFIFPFFSKAGQHLAVLSRGNSSLIPARK